MAKRYTREVSRTPEGKTRVKYVPVQAHPNPSFTGSTGGGGSQPMSQAPAPDVYTPDVAQPVSIAPEPTQPVSRIQKADVYTPDIAQPVSIAPEPTTTFSKIQKAELPMSKAEPDVFKPESVEVFRPMSYATAGGFTKSITPQEAQREYAGLQFKALARGFKRTPEEKERIKTLKQAQEGFITGESPVALTLFSPKGTVSKGISLLAKTKKGAQIVKSTKQAVQGISIAPKAGGGFKFVKAVKPQDLRVIPKKGGGLALVKPENLPKIFTVKRAAVTPSLKGIVTGAKAATKAVKVSKPAKVITAARKTATGRFISDLGLTAAKGTAIVQTAKFTGKVTAPKEQKEAIKEFKGYNEVVAAGFEAERAFLSGQPGFGVPLTERSVSLKSIAYEITPYAGSWFAKGEFEKGAKAKAQELGATGEQLDLIVGSAKRQKSFRSVGETAALLEISRSAEGIGRRGVTKAFEKAGKKGVQIQKKEAFGQLFKISAPQIAKAGAIEGFTQEISQQTARGRDISLKEAGLMGAVGAGTAGIIGGTIVGTKVTRPTVSKVIETGTFITDPFEKPGDVLQDISEAVTKRVTGKTAARPIISKTIAPTDVLALSATKPGRAKKGGVLGFGATTTLTPTKGKAVAPVITPSMVLTPTPETRTNIQKIISGKPGIFEPTPLPISPALPTPTITPTPTPTDTPIPINVNIPTMAQEQTPVTVATQTPISTLINIPTRTPLLRVPPPVPLAVPFQFGAGGTAVRKRKKYVNELVAGKTLFNELVGTPIRKKKKKK